MAASNHFKEENQAMKCAAGENKINAIIEMSNRHVFVCLSMFLPQTSG